MTVTHRMLWVSSTVSEVFLKKRNFFFLGILKRLINATRFALVWIQVMGGYVDKTTLVPRHLVLPDPLYAENDNLFIICCSDLVNSLL